MTGDGDGGTKTAMGAMNMSLVVEMEGRSMSYTFCQILLAD